MSTPTPTQPLARIDWRIVNDAGWRIVELAELRSFGEPRHSEAYTCTTPACILVLDELRRLTVITFSGRIDVIADINVDEFVAIGERLITGVTWDSIYYSL